MCWGGNLSITGTDALHSPLSNQIYSPVQAPLVALVLFQVLPRQTPHCCPWCPVTFSDFSVYFLLSCALVLSVPGVRGLSCGRTGWWHPDLATVTLILCWFLSGAVKSSENQFLSLPSKNPARRSFSPPYFTQNLPGTKHARKWWHRDIINIWQVLLSPHLGTFLLIHFDLWHPANFCCQAKY